MADWRPSSPHSSAPDYYSLFQEEEPCSSGQFIPSPPRQAMGMGFNFCIFFLKGGSEEGRGLGKALKKKDKGKCLICLLTRV